MHFHLTTHQSPHTFTPKLPFPFNNQHPHLIHPSLDRPHPPSQTASGSNQPFYHNILYGQIDRQTDRTADGIGDKCVPRALTLYYTDRERSANNNMTAALITDRVIIFLLSFQINIIVQMLSGGGEGKLLHSFNGRFSRTTWVNQHQEGKPFWNLMKQAMDHTQIIYTPLQTDNHANNSSSGLYRPDAPPDAQLTVLKH